MTTVEILMYLRSHKAQFAQQLSLKIPKAFMKRSLENIMPIDDSKPVPAAFASWPKDFFAKTAGCFAGTPLVREDQGEYEVRDTIQ